MSFSPLSSGPERPPIPGPGSQASGYSVQDMDCHEVEPMLPLIADGTLQPEDDPSLFHHLARCPHCQQQLAIYDLIDLAITEEAPRVAPRSQQWQLNHWAAAGWVAAAGFIWPVDLAPHGSTRQLKQPSIAKPC